MSGLIVGTRGNFAPDSGLILQVVATNATLAAGQRYTATVAGITLALPTATGVRDGVAIELQNSTTGNVTFGTFTVTAGQIARATAIAGVWDLRAWDTKKTLSFAYNGTPLSNNINNPLNASDLFHYLGILAGNGSWVNPSGTSYLTSAASSVSAGTLAMLSDRVSSGQRFFTANAVGSWVGWQFPGLFCCTGFVIQTGHLDPEYPRSFNLRANTGTGLANGIDISGWTTVATFANQTQINQANAYYGLFATSQLTWGNQLAFQVTANAAGNNYCLFQEFIPFGLYQA